MLSCISYNIFKGENLTQIVQWLNSLSSPFDIICFQEFPIAEIDYLKNTLKPSNYNTAYATNFSSGKGVYGELTLILKKKAELLESNIVLMENSVVEQIIFKNKKERSSLITKVLHNNKMFLLANTQLSSYSLNGKRRQQLSKVIKALNSFEVRSNSPVIILGDLNYSSLTKRDKLWDLVKQNNFINGHMEKTHKLLSIIDHQLDYVLYKNCRVQNIEVLKIPFSDHYPMTFSLQI